jgi:1-acyl-sn-glycerol-3-phosphate acyltransferase
MRSVGYFFLNVLQALWLALSSVIWISLALVASIFSRDLPLIMARWLWGPGLVWGSGAELVVHPGASLDPRGPYVFVMNHQSMLDIPVAFSQIPVNLRFIAKRVLKYVPFLGWYMWRTGMVFVDRGRRSQALSSLERAGAQIRNGASVIAYPEGTRTRDGTILPFKKGPFVVALKAGVPIVPVAIEGSGRVLPKSSFAIRPGPVHFRIGEPIPTAGLEPSEKNALIKRVRDALIDLHVSIGGKGGNKEDYLALPGVEGIGRGHAAPDDDEETLAPPAPAVRPAKPSRLEQGPPPPA